MKCVFNTYNFNSGGWVGRNHFLFKFSLTPVRLFLIQSCILMLRCDSFIPNTDLEFVLVHIQHKTICFPSLELLLMIEIEWVYLRYELLRYVFENVEYIIFLKIDRIYVLCLRNPHFF